MSKQDGYTDDDLTRHVSGTKRALIHLKQQVTGTAHLPKPTFSQYNTSHYQQWDPQNPEHDPQNLETLPKWDRKLGFSQYDGALLFNEPTLNHIDDIDDIPRKGVRLSDLAVSRVLKSSLTNKEINGHWPAEFDRNGMVRATRVPLGRGAKKEVQVGHVDVNGRVVQQGEQGWYPMWWVGIHCLCGERGLAIDGYLQRPSWEQPQRDGFGFKITAEAIAEKAHNV